MSTVDEYKAAMNELASASKAYAPIDAYLQKLRETVGYGGNLEFLRSTFGLQYEKSGRRSQDNRHFLDLEQWPSAELIKQAGTRLANAYNSVHRLYAELPPDDQEYVKAPPYQVELR